ncbi:MAG: PepSY-associated TM helix domain-containing protein [Melioribacteraceae bacterium]|nr:PepSY-associated TM helix domain-containing protein [Melioribacteraceae bacterium]MCF8356686.1 PepSY-associated TM helix domain-containing protein [Melioribacteraceae bacterium]MCF8395556.1 PepSY-associated TM helix domain-containing protein [Melioribacteraceae bacterium]MCF8420856.1 PepSY-associated TM helix domain-containing protein [Melioribacteraceae bacterium]
MNWRYWIKVIHRDLGYIAFGLTIIYSISGIAVNHVSDWNPNYIIEIDSLKIKPASDSTLTNDLMRDYLISQINEKDSLINSFRSGPLSMDLFYDKKTYSADLLTGNVSLEIVKNRTVIRETNFLHLNNPKKAWTYVADAFAIILIILALTGLFILKGKKGIAGRGKWLTMLGFVIPIVFLFIYYY